MFAGTFRNSVGIVVPEQTRPRVLLADDHVGVLTTVRRLLASSYDVLDGVTTGYALIEAALKLKPELVVVDIAMPDINGIEVCRQIKRMMPEIRVVILTGSNDAQVRQKAFEVGASGFVLKYAMATHLLPTLAEALRMPFAGALRKPIV
jgi:DNA-binding NarL/FixJ family response regulator